MARDRSRVQPAPSKPRDTIREMAGPGPTIQVPRWIQLVVLPVLLLVVFLLARTLGHVLFLFLTASVIAFTLNPLVRDLTRLKVPRAPAVLVVYAIFAAVVAALLIADRRRRVRPGSERGRPRRRVRHGGAELDGADRGRGGHRPAAALARRSRPRAGPDPQAGQRLDRLAERGRGVELRAARDLVRPGRSVLGGAAALLRDPDRRHLDLHAPRHATAGAGDRRPLPAVRRHAAHPADRGGALGLPQGAGHPLDGHRRERGSRHVRPRRRPGSSTAPSTTPSSSALWTAFVEVIPYIGPWLSAVPPAIYALFVDPPWGVVWVGSSSSSSTRSKAISSCRT